MEYGWKKGFPWGSRADAQQVAERIKALGTPTAYELLEDGRREDAPHHPIFEWEDSVAAEEYRVIQANQILRSIVIVRKDEIEPKAPIRAFVHVVPPGEKTAAYVDIINAMQHPDMRRQVLERAMTEIERWREKYEEYIEFAPIVSAIANARELVRV